jgi:hypothetical protein
VAISLVAQAVGSGVSSANQTITASATVGNFLALFYARSGGCSTGAVTGVTDTGGNTWVSIPCRGCVTGSSNTRIEFWYCQVTASPGTITVASGTAQTNSWNISEWSGLANASPIDASSPDNSGNAASTTATTPTISPAATNDLILAAFHCSQTTTSGLTAGFTELTQFDDAAVGTGRAAYLIDTGSGPYAASWTLGASKANGVITVAVKATAGTTFTQAVAGSLSFIGSLATRLNHHVSKAVSGSLSFTGSLATQVVHQFTKALTGSVSFAGALSTVYTPAPPPPPPAPKVCATPIKGTVMRLTQTDVTGVSLGTLTIVTKSFTQVVMSPTYQEGVEFFERTADGPIIVNLPEPPQMARLQLQVNLCMIDPDAAPAMLSARELMTGPPVSGMGFALMEGVASPHFSLEVWQQVSGANSCDPAGNQRWVYNAWPHCYNTRVSGYTVSNDRSTLTFACETASILDASGPWTAYLPAGAAGQAQPLDRWLWNVTTLAPPGVLVGAYPGLILPGITYPSEPVTLVT